MITKKIITSYTAFLCMAVMLTGATTVLASEVTGTLSSDTSSKSQTSGDIGGDVSNDSGVSGDITGNVSGGSSGSGGSSSSGGGGSGVSLSDNPPGSVLGVDTDNTQTPGFPNAGVNPNQGTNDSSIWSVIKTLLRNTLSF